MKPHLLLFGFLLAISLQAKTYNTPYSFIENKGQIIDQNNNLNPAVKFLWKGNGMKVQLKANSFSYEAMKATHFKRVIPVVNPTSKKGNHNKPSMTDDSVVFYSHRIDVALLGASEHPEIITGTAGKEYLNYYTTSTPEAGVTMVHQYNKVTYTNIYPNIDLEFVLDGTNQQPYKYNFIVRPGGKVSDIQLQYNGANSTNLTAMGSLNIATAYGNVTEQIPTSYLQETGKEIKVNYTQSSNNVYSFDASVYNPQQTLVIDPWCTYYGWQDSMTVYVATAGIPAIDATGNIIVCGTANNQMNIATSGAYQTVFGGGNYDVYMRKFNSSGFPIWCTYYGGGGDDMGFDIDCNESGSFYISGSTDTSSNLATSGSLFPTISNLYDSTYYISFIAKFNNSGIKQWSTYYPCIAPYLAIDNQGNLLFESDIAGWGTSCITFGAFQTINQGDDICFGKFNQNGIRFWATFYGGLGVESNGNITVDNNDNIIVSGNTESTTNIATMGIFQTSYGGLGDLFITKFNSLGQRLWGTYYGSPGDEGNITCVAVDAIGNIYITGRGGYSNFFATPGAFQAAPPTNSSEPLILAKFSSTGQRIWGTYFGGPNDQFIYEMKVDNHDNIIFCGGTNSSVGIGSLNGHHPNLLGGGDGFVEKFNSNGQRIWGSYYGGDSGDDINGMDLDNNGNIVVTGVSASDTGVATQGSYCDTLAPGLFDGFLAFLDSNGTFTTGIGELLPPSSSIIKVYPNPAKDKITVSIKEYTGKGGSISLQSIEGKLLKQQSVKTETTSVDMSGLPSGTYLLQYEDGEVCETVKVVKE